MARHSTSCRQANKFKMQRIQAEVQPEYSTCLCCETELNGFCCADVTTDSSAILTCLLTSLLAFYNYVREIIHLQFKETYQSILSESHTINATELRSKSTYKKVPRSRSRGLEDIQSMWMIKPRFYGCVTRTLITDVTEMSSVISNG